MARQSEEVRRISKLLYGNKLRLEIGAAIARAEPGLVFARGLGGELGVPDSMVHEELKKLAQAGILSMHPRPTGQQIQYYERLPSPFWDGCRALVEHLRTSTR
ncbi:MAG: hypothetical protein ACREV8_13770 [Gammaproteobacteria bacterium]